MANDTENGALLMDTLRMVDRGGKCKEIFL